VELDKLIKHRNIINYVKSQRLRWFGHTNRMPETSVVKKIYKWKPLTGRPTGRPKSRWEDDIRNDMRWVEIVKWPEHVKDRLKWKLIVEKAKTLPELCIRRRRYYFYVFRRYLRRLEVALYQNLKRTKIQGYLK
jgi:hypothetical protein